MLWARAHGGVRVDAPVQLWLLLAACLISGGVALLIFSFYLLALALWSHEHYQTARRQIVVGMLGITALMNVFYFTKVFPPLPLVLSDAGIYHSVKRVNGDYQVTAEKEPPRWRALFGTFPVEHIRPGDRLYAYSAVFAPYRLTTKIVHEWEWRNPKNGNWVRVQEIRYPIHGGRANGYRAYSFKTAPRPGQWRINITTADGRAIGRLRFAVETQAVLPALSVKTLN